MSHVGSTLARCFGLLACALTVATVSVTQGATELDQFLAQENAERKVDTAPLIDDLAFLRRVSLDLIGRIPTLPEIQAYEALPKGERRALVVEGLLKKEEFGDRWTVFMADLLRIRANADGGSALLAWVHKSVQDGLPYDILCRQLIVATGKAGKIPEAGYVLGDGADPMALTATTSQVFMGVRIACAQCHDHPFDVWKREEFYGMASYFGKTARRESELTKAIYIIENQNSTIKWPPEGTAPESERKAMTPAFPFQLEEDSPSLKHVNRLVSLRREQQEALARQQAEKSSSLDSLLGAVEKGKKKDAKDPLDVANQAVNEARALRVEQDLYKMSDLRSRLADLVTNPRNRYFSRSFVNRVWANLLGRGFVEPVDDFSENNAPSHVKTLDYLSDEFVAGGYDLRSLIKMVVASDAYQRAHAYQLDEQRRKAAENAFTAAPVRRMLAESMFDSVVLAGHLFNPKHASGENLKTVREIVQVPVDLDGNAAKTTKSVIQALNQQGGAAMGGAMMASAGGASAGGSYDLESAIEVDFKQVLAMAKKDEPQVEMMKVSNEELEAQRMMMDRATRRKYVDKVVEKVVDDNPKYNSAMRMPSPAPPAHFLRVFGQPARDLLGDHRDHSPSMRQALMMLNGKVTHEASRVGKLEPIYPLLVGKQADLTAAVKMAYREILTREPSADELADAQAVIKEAASEVDGMADLRWVLFNSHEFRFIP